MKIVRHADLPDRPVSHDPAIAKRVLLGRGDAPGLTHFARARFRRGQMAPAHAHPDLWEIFWVESGEGVARVNGADHRLERGTCVLVEPGEAHEIEATGEAGLVLVYLGIEGEPPGGSAWRASAVTRRPPGRPPRSPPGAPPTEREGRRVSGAEL